MNKRLRDIYIDIENNNRDDFLENRLKLDDSWEKSIWGITLQIDLGEEVRDVVGDFQQDLGKIEQGNLLLLPRKYQHISFNQVVFWNGEYRMGKKETWDGVKDEFIEAFRDIAGDLKSFEITFSKLVATSGAIIWCGHDESDELEKMRKYFFEKLPFPKETTYLNHIIHTTIVRYKNLLNNPGKVVDYVDSQKKQATMRVNRIVLRNELVFPSIKTKDIAEIQLR